MEFGFAVLVGLVAIAIVLAIMWRSLSAAARRGGGGDRGDGGG